MNKKNIGQAGEELATLYLSSHGYQVIDRNFTCNFGEVDIIARLEDILCFVEVKTRFNDKYGDGREAVDERKLSHIEKSAAFYVQKTGWKDNYRIEVITVNLSHLRLDGVKEVRYAGNC